MYTIPGENFMNSGRNAFARSNEWTSDIIGYIGGDDHSAGSNLVSSRKIWNENLPNAVDPNGTHIDSLFAILSGLTVVLLSINSSNLGNINGLRR